MRKYTEKQKKAFRDRFVEKQRYQAAMYVPLGGAVILLIASVRNVPDLAEASGTILLGTVGLVVAAVAFSWLNWRCPGCKAWLGIGLSPECCPKCRVELRS